MSRPAGRVLAVDLGDVRIGVALSDPRRVVAHPLRTLEGGGQRRVLDALEHLVREHEVTTVVVGLPLRMSGEEGSRAAAARRFAERLRRRMSGVSVEMWDERLTTVQAERTLISGDVKRGRRKRMVDALAAVVILQSYLDARRVAG